MLSKWSKDLKEDVVEKLVAKGIAPTAFDPKRYPMKMIKERALDRHPLLGRWGGEIGGRVRPRASVRRPLRANGRQFLFRDRKSIGGLVRRSVERVVVDLTFSKTYY